MTPHAQEPVRPFPVVLRPRPDELLSSWLTRHAAYYGVTRRRLLDHVGILSPSVEALDREITLGQQIMLAGYFRRQTFEIAAMSYERVRSNMRALTRPSAPQQSCQACAEKAERADAKGAIGKSWMQGWRITCRVCGARLTNEDDPRMAEVSAKRFSGYWDFALDGESLFESMRRRPLDRDVAAFNRNSSMSATLACSRGIIRRLSNFQGAEYRRFRLRRLCRSNGPEQGNVQRFVPACLAPDSPACRRRYRHARSENNPFQLIRSRAAARAPAFRRS